MQLQVSSRLCTVEGQVSLGRCQCGMQGDCTLASDTWPWRSAPITDPRQGLVCGAEHSPGIVTCSGAVGSHT